MTEKSLRRGRVSNPHSFLKASPGDKFLDIVIWILVIFALSFAAVFILKKLWALLLKILKKGRT